MDTRTHHLGMEGFIWWVGVVESLDDPLHVGRAKVRIFGHHDKSTDVLSANDLPWAFPLLPTTQATHVPNYRYGDWVVGFFLDGPSAQQPVILGVLPTIPQASA